MWTASGRYLDGMLTVGDGSLEGVGFGGWELDYF